MYIGVDYYPEHWSPKRWSLDAQLMKRAGFNVVRLAEFAWAQMEPQEGHFTFDWLDDALKILAKNGISAILGTPTAAMPAWLANKYPETLAMQNNGQRIIWGVRKNNCFTSGAFRHASERITRAMAEHFSHTLNVIGWQTDNEFADPECYCDSCRFEFQQWLKEKYKTLNELNRAWGTHFWGQIYGQWSQIFLPASELRANPSLCLDYRRFHSWLNVRFQRDQVKILRSRCPNHFVTHNFMGLAPLINYFDLAQDLDHVSLDNYPNSDKPMFKSYSSAGMDLMRGLKRKNFWVMETTAGPTGWGIFHRNVWPGELRKFAFSHVAHGADGLIWFRWRSCTAGREQYWHGLLGHDGKPGRRYNEAAAVAREMHKIGHELEGTTVKSDVAIIMDYDSMWALSIQPGYIAPSVWHGNNYLNAIRPYYEALLRAGICVDMIKSQEDFSGYRMIIAPHLHILPDEVAERLTNFVKSGGVLITDCRTGVKTESNLCHERTLPGMLALPLGITITEYERIDDTLSHPVVGGEQFAGNYTAINYADWITAKSAEILAGYTSWHMKKFAAVTRNSFGRGTGYYVGTIFKEDTFYDALIADALQTAKIKSITTPPPGVEMFIRQGKGKKIIFLINHTEEEKTVPTPAGKKELLTGKKTTSNLTLKRLEVAAIKLI